MPNWNRLAVSPRPGPRPARTTRSPCVRGSPTAYSYLIAFRPDGTTALRPRRRGHGPPGKQQPLYPPPAKSDERYRLSEGRPARLRAGRVARAAALVSRVEAAHGRCLGPRGCPANRESSGATTTRVFNPSLPTTRRHPGQGRQGPRLRWPGRELAGWLRGPAGRGCCGPRGVPRRAGLRAVCFASVPEHKSLITILSPSPLQNEAHHEISWHRVSVRAADRIGNRNPRLAHDRPVNVSEPSRSPPAPGLPEADR